MARAAVREVTRDYVALHTLTNNEAARALAQKALCAREQSSEIDAAGLGARGPDEAAGAFAFEVDITGREMVGDVVRGAIELRDPLTLAANLDTDEARPERLADDRRGYRLLSELRND